MERFRCAFRDLRVGDLLTADEVTVERMDWNEEGELWIEFSDGDCGYISNLDRTVHIERED